jgi:TetR/AcrR family hemagglutinin/protease transcriptional regulator
MQNRRRYSPEKRRAMLVDVAIETFADMGIERAGHGDIAKRAKVSTATVFNYFPTKEALTLDVLKELETQITEMFESVPETDGTARDKILALAAAYEKMIQERPAMIKTYLAWSVSFNPDLRPQYIAYQNRLIELIKNNLPEGMKTKTDALIINNAANMIAVMRFDNRSQETLQKFTNRLLDALLPRD